MMVGADGQVLANMEEANVSGFAFAFRVPMDGRRLFNRVEQTPKLSTKSREIISYSWKPNNARFQTSWADFVSRYSCAPRGCNRVRTAIYGRPGSPSFALADQTSGREPIKPVSEALFRFHGHAPAYLAGNRPTPFAIAPEIRLHAPNSLARRHACFRAIGLACRPSPAGQSPALSRVRTARRTHIAARYPDILTAIANGCRASRTETRNRHPHWAGQARHWRQLTAPRLISNELCKRAVSAPASTRPDCRGPLRGPGVRGRFALVPSRSFVKFFAHAWSSTPCSNRTQHP